MIWNSKMYYWKKPLVTGRQAKLSHASNDGGMNLKTSPLLSRKKSITAD